jgi:hypothetical protein
MRASLYGGCNGSNFFIERHTLIYLSDLQEVSLLSFISTCAGQEWDLTDSQIASITRLTIPFFTHKAQKYLV